MGRTLKISQDLVILLEDRRYDEAITELEAEIQVADDLTEFSWISHRLAEVYSLRSASDSDQSRSAHYAVLAGQAYIRLGRFAPALAIIEWLRTNHIELGDQIQMLERLLMRAFGPPRAKKQKHDDHLPPPTPYQELKAFVAFERDDSQLSREQWQDDRPKKVTLFSTLREAEFRKLTQNATLVLLHPGEILFNEGDTAQAFYIVAEGEIDLSSSIGVKKTFGEGDFFGEVALFAGVPRTATLQAKTSVRLLEFNIEKLRECFKEIPSLESNVISFYEFRLFLNVAMRHPLFSHFSERELESIWDYLLPINLGKNQMLIEEGKKGNSFYLISQGYLEVSRPDHGDEIYRLGPGQFIGEDSLLHDRPSSYKVRTETDCLLLECERETFTELCKRFPKLKQVIEEVAAVRYPERFHTDKILVD